ncbi:MAG TPA: ATP-binding protein [Methylomirabilota bacterium]|nr:ATP-binding protein [Methylomirabilota bacterium]
MPESLADALAALARNATLAEAGPHLLSALGEALGSSAGVLWTVEDPRGDPACAAVWEREPGRWQKLASGTALTPSDEPAARAWSTGELARTPEALAWPIRVRGDVLAVLQLDGAIDHPLDRLLIPILASIGDRVAQSLERDRLALERDRLLTREQATLAMAEADARRAALLGELARSINASLELDAILQTVAEGARELCRSDLSAIALREADTGAVVFRYRAGDRLASDERRVVVPGRGAGGLVLQTGRPVRSDDAPRDPRFAGDAEYLAAVARERVVTVLVVPIALGPRIEGLLYVDNCTARSFNDRDEAILGQLADHAAIALRNAHLLAREQRAREEAETANRLKDEFLATLSHELRTPLNAVLGWAVTLRTAQLDAATRTRALEAIERNARAQSQLIEDLLDISRIVTGKLRLDVRLVDPAAVVEAALDAVRPAARAKSIELIPVLSPCTGPVHGDPDRLQQVVWNLLTNAIKFTGAGGRIEVGLARTGSSVEITVTDTGQGIAPALLPFVFDRFRQADSSSTRSQGGLGIGLALVRNLTELHGGTVAAHSAGEGQGATFRVRLPVPVHAEEGVDGAVPGARGMLAGGPPASLAGVRVLVIEDDHDTLELFAGLLRLGGAEVRGVQRSAEALDTLAGWRPDVIVSDIEMPDTDGYAFIRRVRALPAEQGGGVPAVAITAHGSLKDRLDALAAGFQMHVSKPVEPAELIAVVANVARTRPVRSASE